MDKKVIIKQVNEDVNLFLFNNFNAGIDELKIINELCEVLNRY